MKALVVLFLTFGCGRIGFEPEGAGGLPGGGPGADGGAIAGDGGTLGGDGGDTLLIDGGATLETGATCTPACGLGLYCDDDDGMCGGTGTCMPIPPPPTGCQDVLDPVCGCDDNTYSNSCYLGVVPKKHDGACGTDS